MDFFFVCGAPKSGTTWLQRLLDAHPEVCCSGEGHFVERFSNRIAAVVNDYNSLLSAEAEQVYEGRPYYAPVDQSEFDDIVRGFIAGRLMARAEPRARWFGDKTPGYTRQLEPLHRLFPAAKIVHILRDPRGVAVSGMGHRQRTGVPDVFTPGSEEHRKTVEATVRHWTGAVSAVDAFAQAHPGLVHEVRYCDLHDDPIGEAGRLFGFLGAPAPRVLLEQVVAATSFSALSGREPGQEDSRSFLRKGVPDDWKTRLDAASARQITDSCGELMAQKRFAA
ncbi:sulfotransferase family protein [Phenylobacterium sp.]|uniref:sulfotransferase family protein n=1 Tax=Phenylobacterium sp. TaxID=1871053 RepID=UPI00374D67B6